MTRKVLVIGLDGASPALVEKWVEKDILPTLKHIMGEGIYGALRSTIPPTSAPAWVAAMTGRNAGKTGIVSFANRRGTDYAMELANTRRLRGPTIFDILSQSGYLIGAVNIPVTYPPRPVNGFVVSGMMTPSRLSPFTYPASLGPEIISLFDYEIHPGEQIRNPANRLKAFRNGMEKRHQAVLYLLEQYDWDLFWVVYTELDRLQHFYWADMEKHHPAHKDRGFGSAVQDGYRRLDQMVAELIEKAGDDTIVVILSDHGFEGTLNLIYPNAHLYRQNYLSPHSHPISVQVRERTKQGLKKAGLIRPIIRFRNLLFPASRQMKRSAPAFLGDWEQTRAFYDLDDGVRINLFGREPFGIVPFSEYETLRDELIASLFKATDPDTGESIFEAVFRREDLFHGDMLESLPDLIPVARRSPDYRYHYANSVSLRVDRLIAPPANPELTGNHSPVGVLFAYGPGIKTGYRMPETNIIDIAPTLLYLLEHSIPHDMDGDVLEAMVSTQYWSDHPVEHGETNETAFIGAVNQSPEDESLVQERLRNLGYLE
jgi:predicted AlkP superfamily phosphohydrolase/phosphomutase